MPCLARTLVIGVAVVTAMSRGAAQTQQGNAAAQRAIALFQAGDYAAAQGELAVLLRQNPRDATALYYMGRVAEAQDRSGEAVDWLEKAIRQNDRSAEYHLWLANALATETLRAGKLRQPFLAKRVKNEFERAVQLDPGSIPARQGLLQFYAAAPGFMGGSMDRAREQAAEIATLSRLRGHIAAAYLAQREKNFPAAEREYEGAIVLAPDSAAPYVMLGALYQRQQRWDDAFATMDRLLRAVPDDPWAHFYIGRLGAVSGQRLDRAEQSMRRWLAKPPRDARAPSVAGAHHRLGQIYEKQGQPERARAEFREALRINPKNDDARKALAALK